MTLRIVRAPSNPALWDACTDRFLNELDGHTGPTGYDSHLWLTHRIQRDALHAAAAARGVKGWLAPPISFFSDLPELFDVRERPISLMRRRARINRLAAEHGSRIGLDRQGSDRRGIAHALDSLFGELLPEGVSPNRLEKLLAGVGADEFARARNDWVVAVYRDYLGALREAGAAGAAGAEGAEGDRYDPRQIHGIVADRIMAGELVGALNGATRLHIYGLTQRRSRGRLIEALASQADVEVSLYVPLEEDPKRPEFIGPEDFVEGDALDAPVVQAVPDGRREFQWVAHRVKELLVEGKVEPHRIAVVARTGREDARRSYEILRNAGIPVTARIRTPLSEVPALKAILHLFRGPGANWSYRPLRTVLGSAYFDIDIDLRPIDFIARERRVETLPSWAARLCDLQARVERQEAEAGRKKSDYVPLHREGIFADRMNGACRKFDEFRLRIAALGERHTIDGWVDETKRLLDGELFDFRQRVCRHDACDYEIVRLDQQGVEAFRGLLEEWSSIEGDEALDPADWYARLRRFLESNEIALSTPLQMGVRVLEAHEAALFPFRHTFLVHANDGAFPKTPPAGTIFSDLERAELWKRGLPLSHYDLSLKRERALWRAVTANPNVAISYRTSDVRGTPLLPSLMVPRHDEKDAISRKEFLPERPLNESQAHQRAARDLVSAKRQKTPVTIEVVRPMLFRQAVLNGFAETGRRPAGVLGPWNGHIRDPWVLARIRHDFDESYRWSASALERYGSAPFVFLLQNVLRIEEHEQASEETSRLTYGGVAHEILEKFYDAVKDDLPAAFDAEMEKRLDEIAEAVCEARERRADREGEWLGLPALWALTRASIVADVKQYVRRELDWMARKQERPTCCEYPFGFGDEIVVIRGRDVHGIERSMRVRGKIDRVDVVGQDDDAPQRILDYKSGGCPAPSGYKDGSTVQAPLYMKVYREREGVDVELGRYRTLNPRKSFGDKTIVKWASDEFERALAIAFTIPERVRAGKFEAKAASGGWASWDPGIDVRRTDARYEKGSRFDDED